MPEFYDKLLLDIIKCQLFGGAAPKLSAEDVSEIIKEAKAQTVYMLVLAFLRENCGQILSECFPEIAEDFFGGVISNTKNFMEHDELHRLMTSNKIPYVAIKGLSSAYYYPEPALREMGDVDFLVYREDFERAKQVVLNAGFEVDHGDDEDSIHISFSRYPGSIWEQHRSINGIPDGKAGDLIREEMGRCIETARQIESDGAVCMIPDGFHHGLIMLLHMISHLTSEGIGLRHLCDWAVFADKIDNDDFVELFKNKLERFGVWRFAQLVTSACEKYLGIAHKPWAENREFGEETLEELIGDILSGGNFGKKDLNRYREIKYISNRGERTVDNKNLFSQLFGTLNKKTYSDYQWIKKYKVFLPLGWIAEGGRYLGFLISGRRKNSGTVSMLREASKRKELYSKMKLFEPGTD